MTANQPFFCATCSEEIGIPIPSRQVCQHWISMRKGDSVASAVRNHIAVSLVNINEGYNGEYDPKDPDDVNLLRLDVDAVLKDGELFLLDSGSTCTCIPASTPKPILERLVAKLADRVVAAAFGGGNPPFDPDTSEWPNVKHIVEDLSYTGPDAVAQVRRELVAEGVAVPEPVVRDQDSAEGALCTQAQHDEAEWDPSGPDVCDRCDKPRVIADGVS